MYCYPCHSLASCFIYEDCVLRKKIHSLTERVLVTCSLAWYCNDNELRSRSNIYSTPGLEALKHRFPVRFFTLFCPVIIVSLCFFSFIPVVLCAGDHYMFLQVHPCLSRPRGPRFHPLKCLHAVSRRRCSGGPLLHLHFPGPSDSYCSSMIFLFIFHFRVLQFAFSLFSSAVPLVVPARPKV